MGFGLGVKLPKVHSLSSLCVGLSFSVSPIMDVVYGFPCGATWSFLWVGPFATRFDFTCSGKGGSWALDSRTPTNGDSSAHLFGVLLYQRVLGNDPTTRFFVGPINRSCGVLPMSSYIVYLYKHKICSD